jgi:hypothetical protein
MLRMLRVLRVYLFEYHERSTLNILNPSTFSTPQHSQPKNHPFFLLNDQVIFACDATVPSGSRPTDVE